MKKSLGELGDELAATVPTQNDLPMILNHIEQRARWRYADPVSAADSADDVPRLVEALRRAIDALPDDNISRESWWYKAEARDALLDITKILAPVLANPC